MGHCPLAKVEVGARILGVGGLRRARVAYFTQDLAQARETPAGCVRLGDSSLFFGGGFLGSYCMSSLQRGGGGTDWLDGCTSWFLIGSTWIFMGSEKSSFAKTALPRALRTLLKNYP